MYIMYVLYIICIYVHMIYIYIFCNTLFMTFYISASWHKKSVNIYIIFTNIEWDNICKIFNKMLLKDKYFYHK